MSENGVQPPTPSISFEKFMINPIVTYLNHQILGGSFNYWNSQVSPHFSGRCLCVPALALRYFWDRGSGLTQWEHPDCQVNETVAVWRKKIGPRKPSPSFAQSDPIFRRNRWFRHSYLALKSIKTHINLLINMVSWEIPERNGVFFGGNIINTGEVPVVMAKITIRNHPKLIDK